jgi:hypothetical protein
LLVTPEVDCGKLQAGDSSNGMATLAIKYVPADSEVASCPRTRGSQQPVIEGSFGAAKVRRPLVDCEE